MDVNSSENKKIQNENRMTEEMLGPSPKNDESTKSPNLIAEKLQQERLREFFKKQGKTVDDEFLKALSSTACTYKKARTTNQEYGIWSEDPYLKDKDWYKVKRYPLRSSFSSRYTDAMHTGISF